jgi:hypothetical protein
MDVAVKRGGWDDLRCPEPKCKVKLEYEDVQRAASKETFIRYAFSKPQLETNPLNENRYDDLLTERMSKRIHNFTPCNRPDGTCTAGQIHEAGGMSVSISR